MAPPPRRCLDCGTLTRATRCDACRRAHNARYAATPQRKAYHQDRYGGDWRKRSQQIRRAWVEANGWTCPGWQRPAHPSTDLVVDHDVGVLCRSCNGTKAATFDKRGKGTPTPPGGEPRG